MRRIEAPKRTNDYLYAFSSEFAALRRTETKRLRKTPEEIMENGLGFIGLDVDSTLVKVEAVIELARKRGPQVEAQIAEMTNRAMESGENLAETFVKRWDIIRPTRSDLEEVSAKCGENLVNDALLTIAACHMIQSRLHVISGGDIEIVKVVAQSLGISFNNIAANETVFDQNGNYIRLNQDKPLWTTDGKSLVVLRLLKNYQSDFRPDAGTAMVGDGSTDAATKEDVDLFIGYGGVARRSKIEEQSPFYITCESLSPIVVIAAGENNWESLMRHPNFSPLIINGFKHILAGNVILKDGYEILIPKIKKFLDDKGIKIELE